jgi:alkylation response protein AidB-like acyl-CoA dehydrogenase
LPIAITDEQLAIQAAIREWAKRFGPIDAVRAGEPGAAPRDPDQEAERWSSLADLGVFAIGLPGGLGGSDGTSADLAAAVAQLAESLVPGPVLPTLLARLGLAAVPDQPAARYLPAIAAGQVSVAAALEPGSVTAEPQPDGSLRLSGQSGPVLGGASSTHLLLSASIMPVTRLATDAVVRWLIVPVDEPGITVTERAAADFSRSLADVSLDGAVAGPESLLDVGTDTVLDLAAVLGSVEAAGVANWCARTAADYAAIRHQFGRPIGAFQAVKHLCAGMLCRAEAAAVLAWDAARAIDDGPAEFPLAAAAAAAYALDASVANAKDCIQVLGGIGFTWEHDAHLYLRRALALRQLIGGTAAWRDRTAGLALAGVRRRLALAPGGIEGFSPELAEIRDAARGLAARWAAMPAGQRRLAMVDSGYAAPEWPAPYGLGASPAARLAIDHELTTAGIARPDIGIGGWAVAAILGHGTKAQHERFAAATLRGEITWCQLFSEPEAGSDLASLRTRARPAAGDGKGWRLTGQKVWTSLARQAGWAICLARTDPDAPKHKGLTFFLVAMDSPGIDIRPLREITGREMFNEVFLDEVFVPADCVVGAPGDGWRVARTTLASERVAMGAGSSVGETVEDLLELAGRLDRSADPAFRQRCGELVASGLAVSLLDLQAVLTQLRGAEPGSLAAVRKLVGVEHRQAAAEAALELAGPAGALADGDAAALLHDFLLTRCLSIAGGTSQILLSLIAERLLGLPREEAR